MQALRAPLLAGKVNRKIAFDLATHQCYTRRKSCDAKCLKLLNLARGQPSPPLGTTISRKLTFLLPREMAHLAFAFDWAHMEP